MRPVCVARKVAASISGVSDCVSESATKPSKRSGQKPCARKKNAAYATSAAAATKRSGIERSATLSVQCATNGPVTTRAICASESTAPISAPERPRSTSSQRGRNTKMTPVVPNRHDITSVTRAARVAKMLWLSDSALTSLR